MTDNAHAAPIRRRQTHHGVVLTWADGTTSRWSEELRQHAVRRAEPGDRNLPVWL
jgi:hypothetical protein